MIKTSSIILEILRLQGVVDKASPLRSTASKITWQGKISLVNFLMPNSSSNERHILYDIGMNIKPPLSIHIKRARIDRDMIMRSSGHLITYSGKVWIFNAGLAMYT